SYPLDTARRNTDTNERAITAPRAKDWASNSHASAAFENARFAADRRRFVLRRGRRPRGPDRTRLRAALRRCERGRDRPELHQLRAHDGSHGRILAESFQRPRPIHVPPEPAAARRA